MHIVCRFDLGSGAVFIRSEFTVSINRVHVVSASRYAGNVKMVLL